jgi:hypothetical protein
MAFSGKATYDNTELIAEDVAPVVSMISPFETFLLAYLGDASAPATSTLHEWVEDQLSPSTMIASTAVNSATADTAFQINGTGNKLQVGDLLRITGNNSLSYEEILQVTVVTGADSITVSRAFGSVGPSSLAPGGSIELIANAALEGADVTGDLSQNRSRQYNFVQLYQKPVNVSDTQRAVNLLGGVNDEYNYQVAQRTREIVRDLEKNTILGVASGNSFGSDSAYRTSQGLWRSIGAGTTKNAASFSESFLVNVVIRSAWDNGATDLDAIVADGNLKRSLDELADSRIRTTQDEETYRTEINVFESSFGRQQILPANRWMPSNSLIVFGSDRVNVTNLQGRSFQNIPLSRTGHAERTMITGEYTLEVKNSTGHAKAYLD